MSADPDRYAVIGHPIAHSRSPDIHARFAEQTGQRLSYERLLAPLDGFPEAATRFFDAGGRGLNVTVPFKLAAWQWCQHRSERAQLAGAVNTLWCDAAGERHGDNTDGVGLVRDITGHAGVALTGRRVLLLGAGGAARGVLLPLAHAGIACLRIVNRTPARAHELAEHLSEACRVGSGEPCQQPTLQIESGGLDEVGSGWDVVINATASGLADAAPDIDPTCLQQARLAYDMVYGAEPTAFMRMAQQAGAAQCRDGLGMLVEQAAESFRIWRGVLPDTAPVLQALRQMLSTPVGSPGPAPGSALASHPAPLDGAAS